MALDLKDWVKSLGQNALYSLLLALIPASFIAYLAHIKSVWAIPCLEGVAAVLMFWLVYQVYTHLPPKTVMPNLQNIETLVRSWLDTYHVAVKNDPSPDFYFRYLITLDSGLKLIVSRSKERYTEYVEIYVDIGIRGDDKRIWDLFSEEEKARLLLDVKFELARSGVAYGGLTDDPEQFHVFRRVPIQHNLTEFVFMSMVGSVEAAAHLVFLCFQKAKMESEKRRGIAPHTNQLTIKDGNSTNAEHATK